MLASPSYNDLPGPGSQMAFDESPGVSNVFPTAALVQTCLLITQIDRLAFKRVVFVFVAVPSQALEA